MEYLDKEEYDTATRGHRSIEKARPCGHGVYGIVKKGKRTYLAYVLEFPEIPGIISSSDNAAAEVQLSLNIKKEGSYLLIIKVKGVLTSVRIQSLCQIQKQQGECGEG